MHVFFCEEYNEKNVQKLAKEVDDFVRCEICYTDDPTKPFIQSKRAMNQNPYLYKKYQSRKEVAEENTNKEMYEKQLCSMNDILAYVWKYSCLLQDRGSIGFGRWCSGKNIDLIRVTIKRRKVDERVILSVRSLHVLKEKYIANTVKYIIEQLPRYQQTIVSFKKNGYNVIGYVRKSSTKETNQTRTKLLNMMCKNLRARSMVDKISVSFKTNVNEFIVDRDINDGKKVLEGIDADGNTLPGMLKYVSAQKTCRVILTFEGLTTDVDDLVAFLTNNINVEKIVVDSLPHSNTVAVFDRKELLNSQEKIQQFKGKTGFEQRSE